MDEFQKAVLDQLKTLTDGQQAIETRLGGIDNRLEGIDSRLDGIDGRLDGIDNRLDGIDERLDNIESDVSAIKKRQADHTRQLHTLDGAVYNIYEVLTTKADRPEPKQNSQ